MLSFTKPEVKGRFSVVILSYNNLHFFKDCIDSILNQNYRDIEIVLSDDGSSFFDGKEIEQYIKKNNRGNICNCVIIHHQKNIGTVKNINSALSVTTGEFIKCLAIDDELYNQDVLERACFFLQKSSYGIITSNTMVCDFNMVAKKQKKHSKQLILNKKSRSQVFKRLCKRNFIDATGIFETRLFFEQNGFFDERFFLLEDWPKWLSIYTSNKSINYFSFISTKYRSNCGVATGINQKYIEDKKKTFDMFIKPNKKKIGFINYLFIKFLFNIRNSLFLRRIYGFFARKESN